MVNCTTGMSVWGSAHVYSNNITGFEEMGIDAVQGNDATIEDNWISGTGKEGIVLRFACGMIIRNNTLIGCGINAEEIYDWCNDFQIVDNTVNGVTLGFFNVTSGMVLDGNAFGQIILFKCVNSTIIGGTFRNTSSGIVMLYSSITKMQDCQFANCTSGVLSQKSSAVEILNCQFEHCGFEIQGYNSAHFDHVVTNSSVNAKPLTYLKSTSDVQLNTSDHGQIITFDCENIQVSGGSIQDISPGITFAYCITGIIESVDISSNAKRGILLVRTTDCIVRYCNITNQDIGLYMDHTQNNLIVNNTIAYNEIGIRTFGSSNHFYYNNLHDNLFYNAFEGQGPNTWDDGDSMGNWWDDYQGEGLYMIHFDYGCLDYCPIPYDRFPNGVVGDPNPPNVTHTEDIYLDAPRSVWIRWNATDDYSDTYYLYINGNLYETGYWGSWGLTEVYLSFSVGTHNVTIVFEDLGMNTASDTVFVFVSEPTSTPTRPTEVIPDESMILGLVGIIVLVVISSIVIINYILHSKKS